MKNNRQKRENLASKPTLIIVLPRPKGPRGGEDDKAMRRAMWKRYHIHIDMTRDSDYEHHLFYNHDLRSIMGYTEDYDDPMVLEVNPRYYAGGTNYKGEWEYDPGFGETYWKNLLDDAVEVDVEE